MKWLIVVLLAASAGSTTASTCSVSVPSFISSLSLPASIESQIAEAYLCAGSITEIGSIVSIIELTSPTLQTAESIIASYEESYSSIISYIEEVDSTPSYLPPSSLSSFSALTSLHSTLASAISTVISIECSHASLAALQSTLQSIDESQPSILFYLREYTEVASPTLYSDTLVVEEATITSPSIVPTFIEVYTAVSDYEAVNSALESLSAELYTLPLSIDAYVIGYISSPSVVPPSIRYLLSSCYPDVYSDLSTITEFTKSHSTVLTAITNYLSVAETVSNLGSAISAVVNQLMPTLTYQISVMSSIEYTWPSVYTDMEFISCLIATSPTLYRALTTIEETFYSCPSIASSIYMALESPSCVTSPTKISYEEIAHQSFVNAIDEISSFKSAYSTYSEVLSTIMPKLTKAFITERTLLTAASYLSAAISPDSYSASERIETLFSVVSDLTTIMSYISTAIYHDSPLLCYEETIESEEYYYPEYASALWTVYNSPSEITSRFSYYSSLAADYSSLAFAMYYVVEAETSYPLLDVAEASFLRAAQSDQEVLSDFESVSKDISSLSSAVYTVSY